MFKKQKNEQPLWANEGVLAERGCEVFCPTSHKAEKSQVILEIVRRVTKQKSHK